MILASLGHIEWRLSGGASNADPDLSLGGVMSSEQVFGQSFVHMDTISGLTIVTGSSNTIGVAEIIITTDGFGRRWLDWKPSGDVSGGAVQVSEDGLYTLLSGTGTVGGYLSVQVDYSLLPEYGTFRVYVINSRETVFPDVAKTEAGTGSTAYRCLYFFFDNLEGRLDNLSLYLKQDTHSPTTIEIGLDPAGVGGVATTSDGSTAPTGVTFSSPTQGSPLDVGTVFLNKGFALWIKRTIPDHTYKSVKNDLFIIGYGVKLV